MEFLQEFACIWYKKISKNHFFLGQNSCSIFWKSLNNIAKHSLVSVYLPGSIGLFVQKFEHVIALCLLFRCSLDLGQIRE